MRWQSASLMAVCLLTFSQVGAEPMEIRAGEHGDFTRVVLAFESLPSWSAGRVAGGYAVSLIGDEALETDTSRLFALIGRERIRNIDVDREARRLEIQLACECHAEIFELNDVRLVIDVRDGASGPRASHETAFAATTPKPRPLPDETAADDAIKVQISISELNAPSVAPLRSVRGGLADASVVRPKIPEPLPALDNLRESFAAHSDSRTDSVVNLADALSASTSLLPTMEPLPSINSHAVGAITQQLSRAASQGLVEVETSVPDPGSNDIQQAAGTRNFRIFTGLDRDTGLLSDRSSSTARGTGCIADRLVDVGSWGDSSNIGSLGSMRAEIVRETGTVDEVQMLQLAKYYVALGFGAEARFAASFLSPGRDRDVLLALSEIVDKGRSDSALFDGQIACPGKVALWAAIARPFSRAELPISTDGILKTFSALPPHLREHLGPTLSQRLRAAGEAALARAALAAVTRVGAGSAGQSLTSARLRLSGTRADEARAELEELAQGTNVEAVEALIELLVDADRRGVTPKPSWVDDADTLMRVTEGTRAAEELSVAALRGHIPLGRFDELRRALNEDRPGVSNSVQRDISVEALAAAVTDADDETFLRTEMGLSDFAPPDQLDSSIRYAYVARFLELGLQNQAAKYLPDTMESENETALTAATYLALGQQQDALSVLEGAASEDLGKLRANILAITGDFAESARLFAELGDQVLAETQALRSGDWGWIGDRGPESLAVSARAATAPRPDRMLTVGDNSELIEDVTRRRAAYADLLGRTRPITTR